MIDDELYRETFSKLRASEQAKREVLMKIQEKKTKRRLPKACGAPRLPPFWWLLSR